MIRPLKTMAAKDVLQKHSDPNNGSALWKSSKIAKILRALRSKRSSPICKLRCDNGYELTIGIGPKWGFAEHACSNGEPPYLVSVNHDPPKESQVFWIANTETEIRAEHCLPVDIIVQIAMCFVETGELDATVSWMEF
jgi:hypothetical protein